MGDGVKNGPPQAGVPHVNDCMQGVDCWRCEEGVEHTHGPPGTHPPLTAREKSAIDKWFDAGLPGLYGDDGMGDE